MFSITGQFDFLLIRLVFQHLTNPDKGLTKIAELVRPGGSAFIIDALDQYRFFYPDALEYVQFFKAFSEHQASKGMNRDVAEKIQDILKKQPDLLVESHSELLIPSTIPGNLELFEQTYYLVILLLERAGEMKYDFARVKKAWLEWCATPNRYMQVGLRYITVKRA